MARATAAGTAARIFAWLIILGAAVAAGIWYYSQEEHIPVTADTVRRGTVERTIAAVTSGTVMAEQEARLSVSGMGTISEVHVKEGDTVRANDVILSLRHDELDAQVALAEANVSLGLSQLAQARAATGIYAALTDANVAQARAQLEQAEANFGRVQRLAKEDAIARTVVEQATAAVKVARAAESAARTGEREAEIHAEAVRAAETMIEQFEAALAAARAARDRAFLRAPFDGIVAKILLDVGEAAAPGMPVVQLVARDALYITAPFDESYAGALALGQPARVMVDAYPDIVFPGEITHLSPVVFVNPDLSRTLEVHVKVDGQGKLLPGMSADVTIVPEIKENVLFAPAEALERDQFAYVVRDGRARKVAVTTGIGNWEAIEVLDGLQEGDQIITSINNRALEDGVAVSVVEELDS